MSKEHNNRPLIGKGSNVGILLGILFVISIFSVTINFWIYIFLVLCQVLIIILDTLKIRAENNNQGPSLIYGVLTLFLWIFIVPIYIYRRKKYANDKQNSKNVINISSPDFKPTETTLKKFDDRKPVANIQVIHDKNLEEFHPKSKTTTEKPISSNSSGMTWTGNVREIKIHNYNIPDPLIYWTSNTTENVEASCINLNYPIGKPIDEPKGALGYWPRYSSISPNQRANYLEWLSSGRNSELNDIGYAFLFFYGLENRAIIEKMDIPIIIQEVNSLLKNYPISRSFYSYLSSFLAYVAVQQMTRISEDNISQYFPSFIDLSYDQVIVALSWHINHDKAIQWELAYSLANAIPETPKSVVTHKLPTQFKQLFETKFKTKYPEGFKIEPSKRKFKFEYRPASPSLLPYSQNYSMVNQIEPVEINNPLGKKSQFKDILSIWADTIEELRPAARKINKGEQVLTSKAYQALPDSLKQELDHPEKTRWDQVIAKFKNENDSIIVPINSLAELISIEKREKLTPTQSKLLFSTARDVGYILIPDHRITGTPYRWDDSVALFPSPDKRTFTSDSYPAVAFILELGMSIALADGIFSPDEQDHLDRFIFGSFELSPLDVTCLKQYQQILIQNPPSLERLGKRLKEHLSDDNKLTVAKFLKDMASADGILDPNEYQALNKIYKAIGLEKDDIQLLFPSDLTSKPGEQPIQISHSSPVRAGETIVQPTPIEPSFTLDPEQLNKKFRDTQGIQKILNSLMGSEDENSDNSEENIVIPETKMPNECESTKIQRIPSENNLSGLPPKYTIFLQDLLSQNEFTKTEFQNVSRNYGLMANGTIDDINTWSDENYGDYLLEVQDEDLVLINSEIRTKIEEGMN